MYNLRRFYNQNRKKIWKVVIIIASAIFIQQLINYRYKHREIKANENTKEVVTKSEVTEITSQRSTITGDNIPKEKLSKEIETITTFAENCTNQKIEQAYNMLTEECKEKLYSTIQDFKIYYCGNYFNEPRATFEIENWFGNTYKLNITPDIMAVGKVNDNKINQDYITVVKTNGEYKLNINSYIGRTKINVEKEQNNINIKINYKDTYMDYEEFNITAQNNNNKKICLDTKQDVNTMYLEDRNKVQYSAITSEISDRTLVINEKKSNTIDIKYYSRYGSTKIISKIVFSNIILDYDQYESNGRSREMEIAINL